MEEHGKSSQCSMNPPTRVALVMVALLESTTGFIALAAGVWLSRVGGGAYWTLLAGVFLPLTLLLPAGGSILLRTTQAYHLHLLVLPAALLGAPLVLLGILGAPRGLPLVILSSVAFALVEVFFRSPDVQDWFRKGHP